MTARQIIVAGAMPSRDANGRALPSFLKFYSPTTSIPAMVFTTSSMDVAHPWPLPSDDAGRYPQIWADGESYFDCVWTDRDGAQIAAYSNIRPLSDSMSASADAATDAAAQAQEAANEAAASAAEAVATIAELGDFSQAVTDSQTAAETATTKAAEAVASAAAAAASAATVDTDEILSKARGFAICAAATL